MDLFFWFLKLPKTLGNYAQDNIRKMEYQWDLNHVNFITLSKDSYCNFINVFSIMSTMALGHFQYIRIHSRRRFETQTQFSNTAFNGFIINRLTVNQRCQFLITSKECEYRDGHHVVFGKVAEPPS